MHDHGRAALLSIGDELTLGQSLDTNSRWLAEALVKVKVVTVEHATVPDDRSRIARTLGRLMGVADLVITTGGLGPTADDLTRVAMAEALGQELVEDAEAVQQIEAYFRGRGREMPPINRVQALRPALAEIFANANGTAPGLYIHLPGVDVFALPGPPREMRPMFVKEVLPRLHPPAATTIRTHMLYTCGLGESEVATRLAELMERGRNPLVGTTASRAIVTCRIRYEGPAEGLGGRLPEELVQETAAVIRQRLEPYVYSEGGETDSSGASDTSDATHSLLAAAVVRGLRAESRRLAVVESCTGGMLGEMLTEVAGASDVFVGGWITYTNEAKAREVGVSGEVFAHGGPGAVSRECALAMATGGLERSGADECLAITGIAGPDGGTPEKPVGMVWIARASRLPSSAGERAYTVGTDARCFRFAGDRTTVRDWSCKSAFAMLRLHLLGKGEYPLLAEQR